MATQFCCLGGRPTHLPADAAPVPALMGLKGGFWELVEKKAPTAIRQRELGDYLGRTIAIDGNNAVYSFLKTFELSNGPADTLHIYGLFYRTVAFVRAGIFPIYVFDGKPPEEKRGELAERRKGREDAQEELKKKKEEQSGAGAYGDDPPCGLTYGDDPPCGVTYGDDQPCGDDDDYLSAEKNVTGELAYGVGLIGIEDDVICDVTGELAYGVGRIGIEDDVICAGELDDLTGAGAGAGVREDFWAGGGGGKGAQDDDKVEALRMKALRLKSKVATEEHISQIKYLLGLMGVPAIQAVGEGEVLCCKLCKDRKVHAVASEDSDCFPYGASLVLRDFKVGKPTREYNSAKVLEKLNMKSKDQFIDLCVLCGCDYGTSEMAAEEALSLICDHGSIEGIVKSDDSRFKCTDISPYIRARRVYKEPKVNRDVTDVQLKWRGHDAAGLKHFLVEVHGFDEVRVTTAIGYLDYGRSEFMQKKTAEKRKAQTSLHNFFQKQKSPDEDDDTQEVWNKKTRHQL